MKNKTINENFTEDEIKFLYDLISEMWVKGSDGNGLHNGNIIDSKIMKPLFNKIFDMHYEITECM